MEQQNKKGMILGSLLDGSGGFTLGGVLAGIKYYSDLSQKLLAIMCLQSDICAYQKS